MQKPEKIKLYTGDEKLECKGKQLPYSMLQFWQLSLSDIRKDQNILDMDLWDFYVYPTFKIESDPRLEKKNSVSLYRLKKLRVVPVPFDQLYDEIISKIQTVSEYLSQSKKSV